MLAIELAVPDLREVILNGSLFLRDLFGLGLVGAVVVIVADGAVEPSSANAETFGFFGDLFFLLFGSNCPV